MEKSWRRHQGTEREPLSLSAIEHLLNTIYATISSPTIGTKASRLLVQGIAFVSNYLTLTLDTVGMTDIDTKILIKGLLNILNFTVALDSALLIDRLGSRTLFLRSAVGMLVSFIFAPPVQRFLMAPKIPP